MNEISKQKVSILRQRIPVGVQHALALLEKTNGDINNAEILFREEVLQTIVSKTGVAADIAQRHLIKHNYDVNTTLKSIDEERMTLTELIFTRHENKEEVLMQIMHAIEEQYHIKRDTRLDLKTLLGLPQEIFCLMVIMEWLCYEEYEGFDIALSFELDIITDQIEKVLQLSSLASSLRQARDIQELIYQESKVRDDIENYIKATSELRENKTYQKCAGDYHDQRTLLIDTLYDFVKENISKFP